MKVKIKFESTTLDDVKYVDSSFETNAILYEEIDHKKLVYQDDQKQSSSITIYKDYLIVERFGETSGKLTLKQQENTLYELTTKFGKLNFNIYTEELIISENLIWVRYFNEPDINIYHEIRVNIEKL